MGTGTGWNERMTDDGVEELCTRRSTAVSGLTLELGMKSPLKRVVVSIHFHERRHPSNCDQT